MEKHIPDKPSNWKEISIRIRTTFESDTHIVGSARAAGVFAAAAGMPKEGVPLLKVLKSRSVSQRRCLNVYRSGLAVSFVLWKAVVCERRKLVVRSFLQENQKAGHNVNVTSDPS